MEQPFPVLTDLEIRWQEEEIDERYADITVVSDSFLGRSVPRLQHLNFSRFPFPGLPGLLLSATDLICLYLDDIPFGGYFTPEEMVNCLSALTNLEILWLGFESTGRLYQQGQLAHPIRPVLPLLKDFKFKGASLYLEILVAPIVSPLLNSLEIILFRNPELDSPQLLQFVSRTPNVNPPVVAHVDFSAESVSVTFPGALPRKLILEVLCTPAHSQLSSLAQVCNSSYPQILIPAVEHLCFSDTVEPQQDSEDDVEDDQWLEVLRPFTAVKNLYLSRNFVPRIADTLEVFGETAPEVLPALQVLHLEPHSYVAAQVAIEQFVSARRLANQHIAIHWGTYEEGSEVDGLSVVDDSSMVDDSSGFRFSSGLYFSSASSLVACSPVLNYSPVPDDSSVLDDSSVPED